jgi:hypothetical protein
MDSKMLNSFVEQTYGSFENIKTIEENQKIIEEKVKEIQNSNFKKSLAQLGLRHEDVVEKIIEKPNIDYENLNQKYVFEMASKLKNIFD